MTALLAPAAFAVFADLLRKRSGLTIGPDKAYLLETRLGPIARRERLADLAALATRLGAPGAESLAREITEAMTTNESLFFRDAKPFAHVKASVLPRLNAARGPGEALRIWSAAASTGQEAYSLAMTVAELRPTLGARRVEILGTDIAREPLARAREGLYTQFEVQRGLPVQMLMKHFRKEEQNWRIAEALRGAVSFREWNLLDNPAALGRFDIVFCRNVLIYFDPPTKARVLEAIAGQLAPDGVLYLGGAETVLGITERLAPVPDGPGAYAPTAPRRGMAETPAPWDDTGWDDRRWDEATETIAACF
ncbi:MAG: chemotaxis protein CheR [Rhodospirillales bacterium]|nr:chemotaxis protein CheR [Rhodospirillales bacterium]